ncbi:hypothetical protein HA44_11910 [Mixta gaviniae]|nr:hypothetical protein HA44_11910 [Mixta gaviniae]
MPQKSKCGRSQGRGRVTAERKREEAFLPISLFNAVGGHTFADMLRARFRSGVIVKHRTLVGAFQLRQFSKLVTRPFGLMPRFFSRS